ncbi:MAG TPA: hypothetical protein VNA69_06015 [Thermoanaerobaculia bacterium]|nr:hypothetical protein [Thermoanaerobaculia bacterium]
MTDDRFIERLRNDAAALRYEPAPATLTRIRARIQERISRPTVAQLLAAWFRPLAATLAAVAVAAAIAVASLDTSENGFGDTSVEIVMAGDSYRVGE